MLGKIISIEDNDIIIKLDIDITSQANLIGLHAIFDDDKIKVVGEITDVSKDTMKIVILGEIINGRFVPGYNRKPSFKANVRMINMEELEMMFGPQQIKDNTQVYLGLSTIYNNYRVNVDVNQFFSNHFAVIGNTGSGKSFTVSRILQNVFIGSSYVPLNSNIFLFDAYGEYDNALKDLQTKSPLVRYKNYTTNLIYPDSEVLCIPLWLLNTDDIAHLLGVDNPNQLPIIDKALKLVTLLKSDNPEVISHKNDIIARAIMDILMSGNDSSKIRDQIIAVLTNFNTKDLNLESKIIQPGYTRTLKQCLFVDKGGKIQEIELVVSFVSQFMIEGLELKDPDGSVPYTLSDLEKALDFALISEGVLKSNRVFDYANILSVRLHALANSDVATYFSYPEMITREVYIRKLLTSIDGKKCQIINFNINYVDDRIAKAITKILSKLLFDFALSLKQRASIPFHIIIEEAHRYVQNDKDTEILGYNIFDRITKEGRKYGVLLGFITQRPSELSETTISQCSNFIILRTLHPKDLEYIRNMVPNMSAKVMEQLKTLIPGNCIAFGNAFKVPISLRVERPNPEPLSNNADIVDLWY